jgi:hypothetical protein
MVTKLFNYDYNNFAFDYALPFDVNAYLGLKTNDRVYVRLSINSKFIGGIEGLGTKGRIDVPLITFCCLFENFLGSIVTQKGKTINNNPTPLVPV